MILEHSASTLIGLLKILVLPDLAVSQQPRIAPTDIEAHPPIETLESAFKSFVTRSHVPARLSITVSLSKSVQEGN
jgi:hypothetical protein